ncbi:MAG: aminotransferase class V-fold PLP-dependent enzyme [Planctomycetaceae bacterium]
MSPPVRERIYLDNAATSWPKPDAVYAAVDEYQRHCGAAVGRGTTRQAGEVRRIVDRCRERAARLLGAPSAETIHFAFNGTDALNIALHGVLRPGDHVVTTSIEHNSVLRPLAARSANGSGLPSPAFRSIHRDASIPPTSGGR